MQDLQAPTFFREAILEGMNTIRATLEPHADGTVHLPLPPELRQGKVNVVALIELVEPTAGSVDAKPSPNDASHSGARVPDLHPGALQPTADFDDPLPDEFWLGEV